MISQAGLVAMILACGVAFIRGGWVERLAAGSLGLAWISSAAVQDRRLFHHPQTGIFAINLAYAALLLTLMWIDDREWLIWASAFQLLNVLTHVAAALDPRIHQWDFFTAYYIWSYALLGAILAGGIFRRHRLDDGLGAKALSGRVPLHPVLADAVGAAPTRPACDDAGVAKWLRAAQNRGLDSRRG